MLNPKLLNNSLPDNEKAKKYKGILFRVPFFISRKDAKEKEP
jgi:hypothetical protein